MVCNAVRPFQTVSIDLVGPLPPTLDGNVYILSMVDLFTRWAITCPIPSKDCAVVARVLWRELICKMAIPERIYSDRGGEFIGPAVKQMCKRWGIKKIETTGWQPQANPVERIHRWLNAGMTTLHAAMGSEWDHYVETLTFTHNICENASTGFSPFVLVYGRRPRLPDDLMLGFPNDDDRADAESPAEYKDACSKWLALAYKEVHAQQAKIAEANRARREKRMSQASFEVGEMVLYWQPRRGKLEDKPDGTTSKAETRVPQKWTVKWTGPHKVVRRITTNTYVFFDSRRGIEITTHVNRLFAFHPWCEEILSTSTELDETRDWLVGGRAEVGSLIAFGLEGARAVGIGLMLGELEDGSIDFQWVGNAAYNIKTDNQQPGWTDRNAKVYYGPKKKHRSHQAYRGADDQTVVWHRNLYAHAFKFTKKGRLGAAVLRVIHSEMEE